MAWKPDWLWHRPREEVPGIDTTKFFNNLARFLDVQNITGSPVIPVSN
jgi:hypothetical protein